MATITPPVTAFHKARTYRRASSPRSPIPTLAHDEGHTLFDAAARANLSLSGAEFLRQYHAGAIENPERTEVMRVLALRQFAE